MIWCLRNDYTRIKIGNEIKNQYIMPIERKMSDIGGIADILS